MEDTRMGALKLLEDESIFRGRTEDAVVIPDPEYPGCWLVIGDEWACLVYTSGHPLGPDFEEVDYDEAIEELKHKR